MSNITTQANFPDIHKQEDLFSVGDWFYWKCEFDKARKHFQSVLKQSSLSAFDMVRCYKSLGAIEVELKNCDGALEMYNKQLNILEKSDFSNKNQDILLCYISIGKVYWLKQDYNQAITYHRKALEFSQSFMGSRSDVSTIYKNLANIYTNIKQFDLAVEYFQKVLEIDGERLQKDHPQLGQTYANMAIMYQSKQNYEEALSYFRKARVICLKTLLPTHPFVEKIEKAIHKIELKIVDQRSTTTIEASVENIQPVNPSDILTLNNVMIMWLDEHIGRDENCRDLKNEFRQITNSFKMFDSVENCRRCLPHVKNRKIFFIIQGKHAKEIVPDIVEIMSSETKPVVYLFCLNIIYLIEWAEEQECIMEGGIFDDEKHLLATLTNDMKNYIKQKSDERNKYISMDMISIFFTEFTQLFENCCREREKITSSLTTISTQ